MMNELMAESPLFVKKKGIHKMGGEGREWQQTQKHRETQGHT